MNSPPKADFLVLIQTLLKHEVDFIVVGGVSAVLQGAPVTTFDLEIVHSQTSENIQRLLRVLDEMEAMFRGQGERVLKPDSRHLLTQGHSLLMTHAGPLDILGTIGKGFDFPQLMKDTEIVNLKGIGEVRVLSLSKLIEIKKELGQTKDLATIPVLEETLREKQKRTHS